MLMCMCDNGGEDGGGGVGEDAQLGVTAGTRCVPESACILHHSPQPDSLLFSISCLLMFPRCFVASLSFAGEPPINLRGFSISPVRKHLTNHNTDPGLHMRPKDSRGYVSVHFRLSLKVYFGEVRSGFAGWLEPTPSVGVVIFKSGMLEPPRVATASADTSTSLHVSSG